VIGRNRVSMRWLTQRGGAQAVADRQAEYTGDPCPIAAVLGTAAASTLAAVTPAPDTPSAHAFAG